MDYEQGKWNERIEGKLDYVISLLEETDEESSPEEQEAGEEDNTTTN